MSFLHRRIAPARKLAPVPEGVQDFRHEFPDYTEDPPLRWVLPNAMYGYTPVLVQCFPSLVYLRATAERELTDYEVREYGGESVQVLHTGKGRDRIGYGTTRLSHTYETLQEAQEAARLAIEEQRLKLDAQENAVYAVKDPRV